MWQNFFLSGREVGEISFRRGESLRYFELGRVLALTEGRNAAIWKKRCGRTERESKRANKFGIELR